MASATCCGLFFSTRKPVCRCITISTTPPERLATTGTPAAMASTGGMPKPSFQTGITDLVRNYRRRKLQYHRRVSDD